MYPCTLRCDPVTFGMQIDNMEQLSHFFSYRAWGVEGDAARRYFGVFDHLIVSRKKNSSFRDTIR